MCWVASHKCLLVKPGSLPATDITIHVTRSPHRHSIPFLVAACRRPKSPLRSLHASLDASIGLIKAQLADAEAAATAAKAAARSASAGRYRPATAGYGSRGGYSHEASAKSDLGKHLVRFSCEEVRRMKLQFAATCFVEHTSWWLLRAVCSAKYLRPPQKITQFWCLATSA